MKSAGGTGVAGDATPLREQIENLAPEFSWISRSSHMNLFVSGTRMQESGPRWSRDRPASCTEPGAIQSVGTPGVRYCATSEFINRRS